MDELVHGNGLSKLIYTLLVLSTLSSPLPFSRKNLLLH